MALIPTVDDKINDPRFLVELLGTARETDRQISQLAYDLGQPDIALSGSYTDPVVQLDRTSGAKTDVRDFSEPDLWYDSTLLTYILLPERFRDYYATLRPSSSHCPAAASSGRSPFRTKARPTTSLSVGAA